MVKIYVIVSAIFPIEYRAALVIIGQLYLAKAFQESLFFIPADAYLAAVFHYYIGIFPFHVLADVVYIHQMALVYAEEGGAVDVFFHFF